MEITNAQEAKNWAAAWDWTPHAGVLAATIDGLSKAKGLAASAGNVKQVREYAEAIYVLKSIQVALGH